jgi:hypothetical protein
MLQERVEYLGREDFVASAVQELDEIVEVLNF